MTISFYKDTHLMIFLTSIKWSIAAALLPSQGFPYWGAGRERSSSPTIQKFVHSPHLEKFPPGKIPPASFPTKFLFLTH